MQDETVGWVKSIHETRYGELLGLVMVGPHVTDLIEAGVVAIDAESTVETVADGMAPHPTLSEAIKEAGLVALGRAIHIPNRKPAPRRRRSARTARDRPASPPGVDRLDDDADPRAEPEPHLRAAVQALLPRRLPDALALLRNPEEAEDVTQTTFLNAYRALRAGERPASRAVG